MLYIHCLSNEAQKRNNNKKNQPSYTPLGTTVTIAKQTAKVLMDLIIASKQTRIKWFRKMNHSSQTKIIVKTAATTTDVIIVVIMSVCVRSES